MKFLFHCLVLAAMLELCSSQCREADWGKAFDKKGWTACQSTEYLNGLYRNDNWKDNDGIFLIEKARCCKAPAPNQNRPSTHVNANWWKTLDR